MVSFNNTIILERRFVPEGTVLMKQGEPGNCAYLIQSGQAVIYAESGGKMVELAKLEQGQIVGETALIFDSPRSANVKALSDMNLIILTRQTMDQKLRQSDPTIRALVEMLTKRIVSVNNTILNTQSETSDLSDAAKLIYQNVLAALPEKQRDGFQEQVLPKLEDFISAVDGFDAGAVDDVDLEKG